jgi:hypothetical protein
MERGVDSCIAGETAAVEREYGRKSRGCPRLLVLIVELIVVDEVANWKIEAPVYEPVMVLLITPPVHRLESL